MVAWRVAAVAAAVLTASCTSIFDSYYPDSVEFLENQADLGTLVGGKAIVSVHMQVLWSTPGYPHDALAMIVDTDDGQQRVAFYSADLKKIRSYSPATLSSLNGGDPPILYPIMQDAAGFYTGEISYPFSGSGLGAAALVVYPGSNDIAQALTGGQPLSVFQSTYFDDGMGTSFPVIYDSSAQASYGTVDSVLTFNQQLQPPQFSASATTKYPALASAQPNRLLGAACWKKTSSIVFTKQGAAYVATQTSVDPFDFAGGTTEMLQPGSDGIDLSEGWSTIRGPVIRSHEDNGSRLTAFSTKGKEQGSVRVPGSGNDMAFAFHPAGTSWYMFNPATNKVSRYKAWW